MILFKEKNECSGCTACMNICPVKAITMIADDEGFKYPIINGSLCINCGKCVSVCPFKDGFKIGSNFTEPEIFAVRNNDLQTRMNSSSGGVFSAVSDYIIENGGIVYGAVFNKESGVIHSGTGSKDDRDKMRGSKYVQSDLSAIFKEIKTLLNEGKTVLFSGTPCQTAGLYSFSGGHDPNLILCDLVCSGVGSPKVFEDYIKTNYTGSSDLKINFRDKTKGWHKFGISIIENGRLRLLEPSKDPYFHLFLSGYISRSSCFNCKFANFSRPSDITLADFWGIEKTLPQFDDNTGTSLVLINSHAGKDLFNKISDRISFIASDRKSCLQRNLYKSKSFSPKRELFFKEYISSGYLFVEKKYTYRGLLNRILIPAKKILRQIISAIMHRN